MSGALHIELDFDVDGDSIAGTLTCADKRRAFAGWLGLIVGLEQAIGGWRAQESEGEVPSWARDRSA